MITKEGVEKGHRFFEPYPAVRQNQMEIEYDFDKGEITIKRFIREELSNLVIHAKIENIHWEDL